MDGLIDWLTDRPTAVGGNLCCAECEIVTM
jgi:hypothetical protein